MPTLLSPLSMVRVETTAEGTALSAEARLEGRLNGKENIISGPEIYAVKEELPWHKHAAYYLAQGETITAVAGRCDVSPQAVSYMLRNPAFQQRIEDLLRESKTDVMKLIKASAVSAVVVLQEIMENPKAPAAARIAASKEILERNLGKSVQYMEVKATSDNPVADVEALEMEVKRLRESTEPVVFRQA